MKYLINISHKYRYLYTSKAFDKVQARRCWAGLNKYPIPSGTISVYLRCLVLSRSDEHYVELGNVHLLESCKDKVSGYMLTSLARPSVSV